MMNKNPVTTFDRFFDEVSRDLAKSTVGMDQFFGGLRNSLGAYDSYPPYNFEQVDDNSYRITFALAGFSKDDLTVTTKEDWLVIEGKKAEEEQEEDKKFFHRGIATRAFTRSWKLAPNIVVKDASMENGLLTIDLEYIVPEEKKPKLIEIK